MNETRGSLLRNYVWSGSDDGMICIIDAESREILQTICAHNGHLVKYLSLVSSRFDSEVIIFLQKFSQDLIIHYPLRTFYFRGNPGAVQGWLSVLSLLSWLFCRSKSVSWKVWSLSPGEEIVAIWNCSPKAPGSPLLTLLAAALLNSSFFQKKKGWFQSASQFPQWFKAGIVNFKVFLCNLFLIF